MNTIDFEQAKKRRIQEQLTAKLPIIERIYKEGEVLKFEVSGEKEIPKDLLKKE
ncbi:hypothetical protein COE58_24410 [Bacillus cereus]|nr:hypothetical protein COE58_24410 [Bacillus cereus]